MDGGKVEGEGNVGGEIHRRALKFIGIIRLTLMGSATVRAFNVGTTTAIPPSRRSLVKWVATLRVTVDLNATGWLHTSKS